MGVDFFIADIRRQASLQASPFHEWVFPDGTPYVLFYHTKTAYLLRFPEVADFDVSRDGRAVLCWPAPGVSEGTVRHLYLNQVSPLALSRSGKLIFHASAVEIGDEAVAFMGVSGEGKSTLAASFATASFRFLSDDALEVIDCDGEYQIMPSHPSIRLWEDSAAELIGAGAQLAPPVQYTAKARFLAGPSVAFCEQPRRLRHVYFLGDGARYEPGFHRLPPADALIQLVKNSFLLDVDEPALLAAHFDGLVDLVSRPIFYRLDYSRSYEDLARVRKAIVEHATNKASPYEFD